MNLHSGVDIIEIDRIERSILRYEQAFLERVYLPEEIAYCRERGHGMYASFAARFAAKEAVAKMFGCGIGQHLSFLDMQVCIRDGGKPVLDLSAQAQQFSEKMGIFSISISLSHCHQYAVAQAVALSK